MQCCKVFNSKSISGFFLALLIGFPAVASAAAKVNISDESWVSLGAGFRASGSFTEDAAPSGSNYGKDIQIDNARIYLNGQVAPGILAELNTEYKSESDNTKTLKLLDAIVKLEFADEFKVWAGRLLIPSDRNTLNGPFYILMGNFPGVASNFPANFAGRDDGAAIWGEFFESHFKYQAGAFQGTQGGSNQKDNLKYAGRLVYNFLDPESGYYNSGTYFGEKKILALGISGESQKDAAGTSAAPKDFAGFETDILFEYPFSSGVFTAEGGYYNYDYDDSTVDLANQGNAFYAQTAFLFPDEIGNGVLKGRLQPALRIQQFDSDQAGSDVIQYEAGLNYIIKGYNAKLYTTYSFKDTEINDINQFLLGMQLQF
jgi:hypothetical protein